MNAQKNVETSFLKIMEIKMFNELAKKINQGVREKGFWDSMHDALKAISIQFAYTDKEEEENKINTIVRATKDAFIAQKIALIQSECGEALEAMRKNNYGIGKKDSFEDEIADTIIRLLDLCGELNIDIDAQIEWKMGYNAQREAKHGK